jgi:hypothetical protein
MMELMRRHCADESAADALVAHLYQRKALKWFSGERFPGYRPEKRDAWVRAVRNLQHAYVPPRVDDLLPMAQRMRSVLVRHGEVGALASLGAAQRAGRPLEALVVGTALELRVPGLAARPNLVVAPGLRLVPAVEPAGTPPPPPVPVGGLASAAGRYLWPVARRTTRGRQVWAWARARYLNRRQG